MKLRRRAIVTGLSASAFTIGGGRRTFAGPLISRAAETDDEWEVASSSSQGINAVELEKVLDAGQSIYPLRSLIVIRNGYLIAERYYGAAAYSSLSIFSITKSISSLLVGIAMHDGNIKNLDQTLAELLPEAAVHVPEAAINQTTLARVLTQTTGLQPDNTREAVAPLVAAKDAVEYVQHLPLNRSAPPVWQYSNAGCSLLSPILHRAVGAPEDEYAIGRLFSPLGIKEFVWGRDNAGNPMSWDGIRLRTRDLAKIAWMMTDGGQWRGKQVVPADWVRDSTAFHVQVVGMSFSIPLSSDLGYGYLWFTGRVKDQPVAWGWGYGSQFAMTVPSLRLAIVTNAEPSSGHIRQQTLDVMALVTRIIELAV